MSFLTHYFPLLVLAIPAIFWGIKLWLEAYISKSVHARFEQEIEGLKSDLRLKEAKINGLQTHALGGASNRQSRIQTKRIEALEDIWANVGTLGAFRQSSKIMEIVKYDALAERATSDSRVSKMFETLRGGDLKEKFGTLSGEKSRIFVTDEIWATYSAYKSVLIHGYFMLEAVAQGLPNPRNLFNGDGASKVVKAVLPHQSNFLDEHGEDAVFYLVDEIHDKLLKQIKLELVGMTEDVQNVEQAAKIMQLVNSLNAEQLPNLTPAAQ